MSSFCIGPLTKISDQTNSCLSTCSWPSPPGLLIFFTCFHHCLDVCSVESILLTPAPFCLLMSYPPCLCSQAFSKSGIIRCVHPQKRSLRLLFSDDIYISSSYTQIVIKDVGFPGGTEVRNPPARAGDARDESLILKLRRSPGRGNGNPLQYPCLENSMDRGAWQSAVHGAAKNWTHTHTHTHTIWQWVFFTGTSALFQQTLTATGSGDPTYGKGLLSNMPAQIVPLFRDPEDIQTLGRCSGVRLGLVRECFFLQHSLLFIDSLLLLIIMFKAIETAKICIIRYLPFSIQPHPESKRIWTVPYKNFLLYKCEKCNHKGIMFSGW